MAPTQTVASDFVDVQLSAEGVEQVGASGALRITAAHFSYTFKPGTRVRVLSSEWKRVLSSETLNGKTIFELAPAVAPVGPSAKAQAKQAQAEEAAIPSQITQEGK